MNEDLIENYITYISHEKGFSKNTVIAYKNDLLNFFYHIKESINEIREKEVEKFIGILREKNFKIASMNRHIMTLKSFFNFLKKEKIINQNPIVYMRAMKNEFIIPQVLTEAEINLILQESNFNNKNGIRDRALIELLYSTGIRISELVNLKLDHFEDGCIKVMGKGNKERIIPYGIRASRALNKYLDLDLSHTHMFVNDKGEQMNRSAIYMLVKKYAENVGIEKPISPHTFRHTFATHLMNRGADIRVIQELMGHDFITSTERYMHLSQEKVIENFKSFHPRNYSSKCLSQ